MDNKWLFYILMIVTLGVFIGCSDVNAGNKAGAFESYIEIDLDNLVFKDAWRIEQNRKGEGHTFWWRGLEYTTDMYVEVNGGKWVRNSDDIDDSCYYNEWDECGVCNGKGPLTWYFDSDGDGLGDPDVWIKKCTYPSVDEE